MSFFFFSSTGCVHLSYVEYGNVLSWIVSLI
jgi:hypothetical protein